MKYLIFTLTAFYCTKHTIVVWLILLLYVNKLSWRETAVHACSVGVMYVVQLLEATPLLMLVGLKPTDAPLPTLAVLLLFCMYIPTQKWNVAAALASAPLHLDLRVFIADLLFALGPSSFWPAAHAHSRLLALMPNVNILEELHEQRGEERGDA